MTETPSGLIETPCKNVCVMDSRSGLCFGCGRTRDEISDWVSMGAEKRLSITEQLADRMKVFDDNGKTASENSKLKILKFKGPDNAQ